MDGRIDDPKRRLERQRALVNVRNPHAPGHLEGGKGTTSKAVKFQLRPDPLAD